MAQPGHDQGDGARPDPRVETPVSRSNCGRPICTDRMVFGPVGSDARMRRRTDRAEARRQQMQTAARNRLPAAAVTIAAITLNVAVFLGEMASEAGSRASAGRCTRRERSSGHSSRPGNGGGSAPTRSCTQACSTSSSTCSRSGGSAASSRATSAIGASSASTSRPHWRAPPEPFCFRPTRRRWVRQGRYSGSSVRRSWSSAKHIRIFGGAALPIVVLNLVFHVHLRKHLDRRSSRRSRRRSGRHARPVEMGSRPARRARQHRRDRRRLRHKRRDRVLPGTRVRLSQFGSTTRPRVRCTRRRTGGSDDRRS